MHSPPLFSRLIANHSARDLTTLSSVWYSLCIARFVLRAAGVGYNWIDGLKDFCERQISESELLKAAETFPHDPPKTKEGYYYRVLFEEIFGEQKGVKGLREGVENWIPLWSDNDDPSGRAQKFHAAAYSKVANGEQE